MREDNTLTPAQWWEPMKNYRKTVRDYYLTHLGCTRQECAAALGINVQTVKRHINAMRKDWDAKPLIEKPNLSAHNERKKARQAEPAERRDAA